MESSAAQHSTEQASQGGMHVTSADTAAAERAEISIRGAHLDYLLVVGR